MKIPVLLYIVCIIKISKCIYNIKKESLANVSKKIIKPPSQSWCKTAEVYSGWHPSI